ncbi:MAG: hypothetical protein RMK29_09800 [Myxococcales bacterium]|nr:hypothetical protein [Myxococcota bacterium]MDW8281995.1 hypothetical protein [Myxococcales bacterium]
MPIGLARHGGLPTQDQKDPVDAKLTWLLRHGSRLPSLPDSDASPDEVLLRYVEGSLNRDLHQVVERRLADDHGARCRVSLLKSALAESEGPPLPKKERSHILLYFAKGKLHLLRAPQAAESPTPGGTVLIAMPQLGPGAILHLMVMEGGVGVQVRGPGVTGVSLRHGAAEPLQAHADGEGGFRLAAVAPARYELRVHKGPEEIPLVLDIRTG